MPLLVLRQMKSKQGEEEKHGGGAITETAASIAVRSPRRGVLLWDTSSTGGDRDKCSLFNGVKHVKRDTEIIEREDKGGGWDAEFCSFI